MSGEHDTIRDFLWLEHTGFFFWGIKVESPMGGEDKKAEIYEDDGKICKDFKLRRDMVEFLPSRLF